MSSNARLQRNDTPTPLWITTSTQGQSSSSSAVHQRRRVPVDIRCPNVVWCLAFLDGEHIVSGNSKRNIRRWRVEDGGEVGVPMYTWSGVYSIAASRNGRWIVNGTESGVVQVWDAETHSQVRGIRAHLAAVWAVDISLDATRIASGSDDYTACVWSLETGNLLLGPWEHDDVVASIKFSPDGRLVATATHNRHSVRVYDKHGWCLFAVAIRVGCLRNNSLAWSADGNRLFALSRNGGIHSLDALTGTTLAKWSVHRTEDVSCIAVARNGTFVAASAGSSVFLWDTTTQQQIGSVVQFNHPVLFLAISDDHDLAASGNCEISIRNLGDILPPSYTWNKKIGRQVYESNDEVHGGEDVYVSSAPPEKAIEQRCEPRDVQRTTEELLHDEIVQLKVTNENLLRGLAQSRRAVDEQMAQTESWKMKADAENAELKQANQELRSVVRAHEQKYQYETLHTQARPVDAAKMLLEIERSAGEHIKGNEFLSNWLIESISRCNEALEQNGDDAWNAGKREGAATAYAAVLSLGSSNTSAVLAKWASAVLTDCSAHEALRASIEFKASRFAVYRVVCDALQGVSPISEVVEIFRQMQDDLRETGPSNERTRWESDFRDRCAEKLANLGDTAKDSNKHEEAIRYYSEAMSLDPTSPHELRLKRSNELIKLDPSSHRGYEEKHAALHGMGRYGEAFEAFKEMLSILEQSRDPEIRELRSLYIDATSAIRNEVWEAIRHLPTVLIDTDTGRLYDKTHQAAAFEELPIYDELLSSMTTTLDHSRIQQKVSEFYRYVMFSHKWQLGEPTFQQVENDSVYSVPSSPTFDKLRNFCKLVVALQYKWAWSDTCCVNQLDKGVQQESIVAMFRWYRYSSLTVVHLLGVLSEWQKAGCLWKSIWNTRGWTYQEYVASEVVQFYTEDWKPYLGLQIFNHKESPVVLSEMERATNVTTRQLVILQPGLDRAREKLYLASGRQTMREEDMAYSLFGIFGISLPVVYGEGNLAIGRLLEHILTRSDEVTLLAWTGRSGSHYSYLPASLSVYNEIVPPHIPTLVETSKMDEMVTSLRSSIPDLTLVTELYNHLHDLPPLSLLAGRLRLPGLVFKLGDLSPSDAESNVHVYHTTTPLLGDVEIKTTADLSEMRGLRLIHPWISPLIDQDFSFDDALFDLPTRALRLLVRLWQPFGGLLLASTGRSQYRRVATDSLIVVRIREDGPLSELLDAVQTVQIQ